MIDIITLVHFYNKYLPLESTVGSSGIANGGIHKALLVLSVTIVTR